METYVNGLIHIGKGLNPKLRLAILIDAGCHSLNIRAMIHLDGRHHFIHAAECLVMRSGVRIDRIVLVIDILHHFADTQLAIPRICLCSFLH